MALFHLHTKDRTDEELMTQVKGGSGRAFDELYRRYARRLNGFFFCQLGGDPERAADAVQDVMLRLYEARSRYKTGENVATWVFAMAYNLCKNQYRHLAHEQNYLAQLDTEPITESQVEVQMDRRQLEEALQQVLTSLSPPLRMLFSLRYEEDLTVPQIAQIQELPEGTVKSRLHKTMNIIRNKLKEYEHQQ
ncbi:MAG: sigma-70 family RNA polymerase sigma factor [Prevotella sp.]|nr:sigma-70 family RNA polymerase sigma factor [Prevotella sp.]